jgi:hypothetical protein
VPIFSGLEIVGSVAFEDSSSCEDILVRSEVNFSFRAQLPKKHGGASKVEFVDFASKKILEALYEDESEVTTMLHSQTLMLHTALCPRLVYINQNEERSPLRAIESAVTRFKLEHAAAPFIAKGSSTTRFLSLGNISELSVSDFCAQMFPTKSEGGGGKRKTKTSAQTAKKAPLLLELQILRDHSACHNSPTAVSIRYDAIKPSEPSLDDSTHEDFEKNAPVFHAFYPRISTITYITKDDTQEESMHRALIRHSKSIWSQLVTYLELANSLENVSSVPRIEPFHYTIEHGKSLFGDVTTLWYEHSRTNADLWLEQYQKRLIIDETARFQSFAPSVPQLDQDRSSTQRSSGRSSLNDSMDASSSAETRIMNIHRHVPSPGERYRVHLIKGSYEYYHYCQDGFDDKGWGCAYRSMQTLVSWIVKQNLSIKAVPTHTEIQRMLVDMLDKPPSFVNSKQWIGAVEISMCLSQNWDVMCKILHATTGSKIADFTPELVSHFDNLGSPIMIGGSTLAYTIIGVAVADPPAKLSNGQPDVKYLILDPHYSGTENIDSIVSKGWCAWQSPSLWQKEAFYNLCLPQTPKLEDSS